MEPNKELASAFLSRAKAIANNPGGFDFRAALDLAEEVTNSGLGFGTRPPARMAATALSQVIGRRHSEADEMGVRNTFMSLIIALRRIVNQTDE